MKQENLNTDNIYSAFRKWDNWREYSYEKRILDSFASVFHLKGAVTATCKYKNNLYISYNHQISSAENHIKNEIKLFDFIVKKGSAADLLNFYLILNVDHKEFIKNQWLHEWKSFSESVNTTLKLKDFIKKCSKENIVLPAFLSLLEEFSNQQEYLKQDLQNSLKQNLQYNGYEALLKAEKYNIHPIYSKLVGHSPKIINVELKELLIRPLQDCFKIKDCVSKGYLIDEFILIDNKNGVHADINIADNFPLTKPDYVGVSRLACGYCHDYLSKKEILHRGTHGIIDPKWKMNLPSPEEEDFKKNILKHTQEVEKGSESIQHRRLSFDYFEKDILIGNDQTLCKLKCDLLGSQNYDIADEYGYYVFTDHGYVQIN